MRYSGRMGTVMTVDADNKLQLRQVSYTGTDGGLVAVSEGLKEGETVVVGGELALKPGDRVTAVRPSAEGDKPAPNGDKP